MIFGALLSEAAIMTRLTVEAGNLREAGDKDVVGTVRGRCNKLKPY